MRSIRVKITAITLAAILTSILSIFIIGYLTIRAETDRRSVETMNLIGMNTQKDLDMYLESIEQSVEMTANLAIDSLDSAILVRSGVAGTRAGQAQRTAQQVQELDAHLAAHCAKIQEAFASVASRTNGVVTYYYCISDDVSQTVHGFFYSRVGKTGFEEREPLIARELDPADIAHTTWYYTPIRRGRPSWVGPYTAHFLREMWTCSYLVPIYKSGAFIGVLGMDIPLDTLVEQVRTIRVYRTGYACLVDENGRIVYHPSLPMGSLPDGFGITGIGEKLKQDDSGDELIRYESGGRQRQMTFTTLSNGMKLVITAPVAEINATWLRLERIIIAVAAAVIALFAVILLLVMRLITNPLQRLTVASQQLAAGDYDVELDYRGRDEVGQLTGAFMQMRDQQKQSFDDLNRKILTDNLTGLPNMRYFFKLAMEQRSRLLEEGKHPVMLYFDLIDMKQFNRQNGFDAGDDLIRAVGRILSKHFGERCICRFSGDHFAAVSEEDAVEDRLKQVFEECRTANGGNTQPLRVGIYPNRLEDVTVSVACDRAKFACDQARGTYENSYQYFDTQMLRLGEDYRYVIRNIDRAIEEKWIKVYYQAIIRAADGKVCDEEALSRWIDPVRGFLSPAEFIPALEQSKLIYKLDLYVVEQILEKMKRQAAAGMYVVPVSVNLSRMDFESCDIVEEIRRRVDEAGVDRAMLTIEITESVIGSDFDFMKQQVERFQKLGFQVWMDDFGSGYSSLDVLQNIRFDLLKFDMRFMERFNEGDEGKIILTELTKMAIGLGVETVCEGVEQEDQVEFLKEIGCTKIQGYYYGKPMPFEDMLSMYERGVDMGFENPEESEYYATLGRINLYDMAVLTSEGDESLRRFFDTLPMAIMEVNGTKVRYSRCNKTYREFLDRAFGMTMTNQELDYTGMPVGSGASFMSAVIRCSRDGNRAVVDEQIHNGKHTIHSFVRRVAVNPVTGTAAVAVAVLAVLEENSDGGASYANIARALSTDYVNLYYVDLETGAFIEYTSDATREDLAVERRGDDFFGASAKDAQLFLYEEDRAYFTDSFTREKVVRALDEHGSFTLTYRLLMGDAPTYVHMKAVRMPLDPAHIIIGVSNVDAQMRQKEAMARLQAEQLTYSRVNALAGGYICIYTVDPATGHYYQYSATSDYAGLNTSRQGDDFFGQAKVDSARHVDPEDLGKFRALFTRDKVMEEIEKRGIFTLQYRIILNGRPTYVEIKAAMVQEQDGPQLIVGINNIDAQVRREQDIESKLAAARSRANLDTLTGVKNRTAYDSMSAALARQIEGGQSVRYAIALCRVAGLARVNEERGRDAGDELIREACAIICETFKHSPVFRVAGDQFAAIAQGHDYEHVDELIVELEETNRRNRASGGAVIACGMARYDGTGSVASVFERADAGCSREEE